MSNWDTFKKEFSDAGSDIHCNRFIVEWGESNDIFDSLHGTMNGTKQDLIHDVKFRNLFSDFQT